MPKSEKEWNPEAEQSSLRGREDAHGEEYWRQKLTPEQFRIMREKGTEMPFTGGYLHEKADGTYACTACGNPLFASDAKFDSGTGWPSFDTALPGAIETHRDTSHLPAPQSEAARQAGGMPARPDDTGRSGGERTEITCARCSSHLGNVFDDGPTKTGKRYCINSVCLDLEQN